MDKKMEILKSLLFILALLALPANAQAETATLIRFGIFPYISPAKLVKYHTPLKQLISESVKQPVSMMTAPDFTSFIDNTRKGQYDFILTAPHLARLAEKESGYQRVLRTSSQVRGIFLTNKNSGIERLEQLEHRTIMIAQRSSVLFQMSEKQLQDHGLIDGKNITILEAHTHSNSISAPLRGEADAAVTGARLFQSLQHELRDQLNIIAETPAVPGLMIMAHPRVPREKVTQVQQAGLSFNDTVEGKEYFQRTRLQGFEIITNEAMRSLDGYLNIGAAQ